MGKKKKIIANLARLLALQLVVFGLIGCAATTIIISRIEPPRYKIPSGKVLAVLDFAGTEKYPESGRAVASALLARLLPTEYYQIVERAQIQKVIKEIKFTYTDYVDPEKVAKIGKMSGADYVIVGEVTAYDVEDNVTVKPGYEVGGGYFDKHGRWIDARTMVPPREVIVRSATVAATFRLVEVETGRVIASDQQRRSDGRSSEEFLGTGGLPAAEDMLNRLMEEVVAAFINKIAPQRVFERRVLEYGTHSLVRKGVQLAKNGLWREAVETWQKATNYAPQDSAIYHNLGVAAEAKGDYEAAEKLYKKALELQPNKSRYMQNLNRVRQLKRLYEKRPLI